MTAAARARIAAVVETLGQPTRIRRSFDAVPNVYLRWDLEAMGVFVYVEIYSKGGFYLLMADMWEPVETESISVTVHPPMVYRSAQEAR